MKRVTAPLVIPLLLLALVGLSLISWRSMASAITQTGQSQKGSRRDVCITNCLRTYEKCQRRATSATQTKACYQQFEVCQQGCYDGKKQ